MAKLVRRASILRLPVTFAICFVAVFSLLSVPLPNSVTKAQEARSNETNRRKSPDRQDNAKEPLYENPLLDALPSMDPGESNAYPVVEGQEVGSDLGSAIEPNNTFATATALAGTE